MDVFAALPALSDELDMLAESVKGRLATVIEMRAHEVRVQLAGKPSALWHPATEHEVPVGTTGVLVPLRGGQSLFVVVGQPNPGASRLAPRVGDLINPLTHGVGMVRPYVQIATSDTIIASPVYVPRRVTVGTMFVAFDESGTSVVLRGGVYRWDRSARVLTLVTDPFTATTMTGYTRTFDASATLDPGWYAIAVCKSPGSLFHGFNPALLFPHSFLTGFSAWHFPLANSGATPMPTTLNEASASLMQELPIPAMGVAITGIG